MRPNNLRQTLVILLGLALTLGAFSCAEKQGAEFELPTFYTSEVLDQVREHVTAGYETLDKGDLEGAVGQFAEISNLVSTGLAAEYHTACAYGRTGNTDRAFVWLEKLVANGYDSPGQLKDDQDLESLKADPRFDDIIARAEKNAEAANALIAKGMPEYDNPPQEFASEEELGDWVSDQNRLIRGHQQVWTSASYTMARTDLAAKKLAALRKLKADDPEFDYGLQRVREATSLMSPYDTWGAVSDMAMSEIKKYVSGSPTGPNLSEANYRAALSLTLKFSDDDPSRDQAFSEANGYLSKVDEETEYYGAAKALMLANQVRLPGADENALGEELKAIVEQYGDDRNAYRIIATQLGPKAAQMMWPIKLDLPDLDKKQIQLDKYKGKVLLIDFWATWCPPCRAELPTIVEVYNKYNKQGFEIVSVSLDYERQTSLDDYRKWIDEHDMNWRHTYDGKGWDTPIIRDFFVSSIPAPFLVGKDGSLVAYGDDCRGEMLEESVKKALGI